MNKSTIKKAAVLAAFSLIAGGFAAAAVNADVLTEETDTEEISVFTECLAENNAAEKAAVCSDDVVFKSEKDEVWHKMLNTVDYISCVSGEIIYANSPNDSLYVKYWTDIDNSEAYTSISEVDTADIYEMIDTNKFEYNSKSTCDMEVFTDKNSLITLDNINKTAVCDEYAVLTRDNSAPIDDSKRVVTEEDGTAGYYYRCDITNTFLASQSLFPQEMAFGFLTDYDLWTIESIEEYNGRECFLISGKTSEDYASKTTVDSFVFYVDRETGMLLKYIGYDCSGDIYAYLITDNVKFGSEAESISTPDIDGYEFTE